MLRLAAFRLLCCALPTSGVTLRLRPSPFFVCARSVSSSDSIPKSPRRLRWASMSAVSSLAKRAFSAVRDEVAGGEQRIKKILEANFPGAVEIDVQDVSGGCGSMYAIYLEAEEFRGKKTLDQQRMVNAILEKEIKAMHGLTLQTAVPSSPKASS